jgi:hypothetical protein
MDTIIKVHLFFFLAYIFGGGCAEKLPGSNKLNLKINMVKPYSWINLMPGMIPSFHFSCEVLIQNNGGEPVENLQLQRVTVYEDTLELLKFKPEFINRKDPSNNNIQPEELTEFSVSAPGKIKIDNLKKVEVINLLLYFTSMDKPFIYKIDNVKIERVY